MKIYISPHVYISHWKKGVHGVQGGEKALEKAHKREKTREIACTLQSKMVCSEVCMACRRCAAHVGMAPLFLGVLLLPPTFQGTRANFFELISAHKRAEIGSEQG